MLITIPHVDELLYITIIKIYDTEKYNAEFVILYKYIEINNQSLLMIVSL